MDKNEFMAYQGLALKQIRQDKTSFTITSASAEIGRSRVWLSEIELGKKDIYFSDVKKLCKLYGVSLDYLNDLIDTLIKKEN